MADLQNTSIETAVSTNEIRKSDDSVAIDAGKIDAGDRYQRQFILQRDLTSRSSGQSWTQGPVFDEITGFKANSWLHLYYLVPTRNNDAGWGGCYIEPQIQFNQDGTWHSLGSCGYDGGVMGHEDRIVAYRNFMLIDPQQTNDFSIQFRFYFRSYSNTVYWNGNRDIGLTSETANLLNSNINDNHHMHVKIKELARLDNG